MKLTMVRIIFFTVKQIIFNNQLCNKNTKKTLKCVKLPSKLNFKTLLFFNMLYYIQY